MALRTYFWHSRVMSKFEYYKAKLLGRKITGFRHGNAGDIFTKDLIKYLYKEEVYNSREEGNRLLMVGSIASVIKDTDIINGIGWKGNDLEDIKDNISKAKVYGVRGPLTKQLFEKYNADLSELKFMLDPGLLVKEVYNLKIKNNTNKQIIFIPHYNDELVYTHYPKNIKKVSIDNNPKTIAKEIMKSEVIYSSSLHGIIFSHALNKPCVFVAPQSNEPIFKYEDYFLSIGVDLPKPIKSIYEADLIKDVKTILKKEITIDDFYFPSLDELKARKTIF